jgi:two-component system NtrC family sensor kinase
VRRAEEDWMRQMFSGTIHNIGNVITVARLAVSELEEANNEKGEVLKVILDEILPDIQRRVASGEVGEFLLHDPKGREYLASIQQLLEHQKKILREQSETVKALNQKLNHITEIIGLQQRLVSGVGRQEVVAIDSLIKDAVKMMSESANRHDVSVRLALQGRDLVDVDSSMMTQVFINLVKNAIEALDETRDRERLITIGTEHVERDGQPWVCCTVADTGPGMTPAVHAKVFEFGFTTKASSQDYGRGVGLNYCRRTVERFRGQLDVASVVGEGATFRLWLPAAPVEE